MLLETSFNQGVLGSIPRRLTNTFRNIRGIYRLAAPLVPTSGAKRSSTGAVEPLHPLSVPSREPVCVMGERRRRPGVPELRGYVRDGSALRE